MEASNTQTSARAKLNRLFGKAPDEAPSAPAPGSGSSSGTVLELAAERIRGVVEAAERAATDIGRQADAYAEANRVDPNRINRERLVAELARSLADRADGLSRDAAELEALLKRAGARLAGSETGETGKTGASQPPPVEVPASPEAEQEALAQRVTDRFVAAPDEGKSGTSGAKFRPRSRPAAPIPSPETSETSSEGLRLLATQMAVAGSSRTDIEHRLRQEFGVTDASTVLAEVLGPQRAA